MEYYLQNRNMPYLGNSPMWWRKGGSGYTADIDDAEIFTKEDADSTIRSCKGTHNFKKWSVKKVLKCVYRTVDMQSLNRTVRKPK